VARKKTFASCHPDRPHVARGLCRTCYCNAYNAANREATRVANKNWVAKNKSKVYESSLKYLYGADIKAVRKALKSRKGFCKICGIEKATCYDHDHRTGAWRGMLCNGCNSLLGHAQDSYELLNNMLAYLEKHSA